jgi:purine-binding chemotaxis protein CheW
MKEGLMTRPVETHESKVEKFLTFCLADQEYGLEILRVREIIGVMDITAVPRTPDYVKGVINLRGSVIPVIDLRQRLGLEVAPHTDETCIIFADVGSIEIGTIVDRVSEVLDIETSEIEDAPTFDGTVETDFILGMGKTNQRVTILLDISRVLRADEIAAIVK